MTGPTLGYPLPPERACPNHEHACIKPYTLLQATAPLQLYDTWVTRDAAGRHASKLPPYLQDPAGKAGFWGQGLGSLSISARNPRTTPHRWHTFAPTVSLHHFLACRGDLDL